MVPAGIADLHPVYPDLACVIVGDKAQHQLSGKGPGLAAEVADILDLDRHFLGYLSMQGRFHRFAGFDKAGQRAVHPFGEAGGAGQQHLLAAGDQHDDARRDSRIPGQRAGRAEPGLLGGVVHRLSPAAAAKPMGLVPVQGLGGLAPEFEALVIDPAHEAAQWYPLEVGPGQGLGMQVYCKVGVFRTLAKRQNGLGQGFQGRPFPGDWADFRALLANKDPAPLKDEVVVFAHRLPATLMDAVIPIPGPCLRGPVGPAQGNARRRDDMVGKAELGADAVHSIPAGMDTQPAGAQA